MSYESCVTILAALYGEGDRGGLEGYLEKVCRSVREIIWRRRGVIHAELECKQPSRPRNLVRKKMVVRRGEVKAERDVVGAFAEAYSEGVVKYGKGVQTDGDDHEDLEPTSNTMKKKKNQKVSRGTMVCPMASDTHTMTGHPSRNRMTQTKIIKTHDTSAASKTPSPTPPQKASRSISTHTTEPEPTQSCENFGCQVNTMPQHKPGRVFKTTQTDEKRIWQSRVGYVHGGFYDLCREILIKTGKAGEVRELFDSVKRLQRASSHATMALVVGKLRLKRIHAAANQLQTINNYLPEVKKLDLTEAESKAPASYQLHAHYCQQGYHIAEVNRVKIKALKELFTIQTNHLSTLESRKVASTTEVHAVISYARSLVQEVHYPPRAVKRTTVRQYPIYKSSRAEQLLEDLEHLKHTPSFSDM